MIFNHNLEKYLCYLNQVFVLFVKFNIVLKLLKIANDLNQKIAQLELTESSSLYNRNNLSLTKKTNCTLSYANSTHEISLLYSCLFEHFRVRNNITYL